jgi:hypothetical protein
MDDKLFLKLLTKSNFVQKLFNIKNYSKVLKMIDIFDKIIVFNWKNGYKLLNRFKDKSKTNMFPNFKSTNLIRDRIAQLGKYSLSVLNIDTSLKRFVYNSKHIYPECYIQENIPSDKIVLKLANSHQGINKFLVYNSFQGIKPLLSNNQVKTILGEYPYILIEEYIENARSIRVIVIKDKTFIIEHINDSNWIKNVQIDNTFKEIVNPELNDNIKIELLKNATDTTKYFDCDFCGIDFLITDNRIAFLEINDMIGLPDNDEIYNCAVDYFKEFIDG